VSTGPLSMQRDVRPSEIADHERQLGHMLRVGYLYWRFTLRCWGAQTMNEIRKEIMLQNVHRDRVLSLSFCLEKISEQQSLLKFRFKKAHIRRLAMEIPYAVDDDGFVRTKRRRYKVDVVEATCILLRRLATPCRWADLTIEFGRHSSKLSEVFCCALDSFYDKF
jgi:hypothetical protein